MKTITKKQIQEKINFSEAIRETKKAFLAYYQKKILMPPPFVFDLPKNNGEICIKTSISEELSTYTIKLVSVFNSNKKIDLPTLQGTMNIFNSKTGELLAVINEEGWLTNLRTACAGALADKYFRQKSAQTLGIIGAGAQAEFQATVILQENKQYQNLFIWNRNSDRAEKYIDKMKQKFPNINFYLCQNLSELTQQADTIITTTPSTNPLLTPELINRKITIIAVGSDMPQKCEISPDLYKKADKIYLDSIDSNLKLGGISRAIKEKIISQNDITKELGEVIEKNSDRQNDNELIIIKLVGLGSQDTYIGNLAYQKIK